MISINGTVHVPYVLRTELANAVFGVVGTAGMMGNILALVCQYGMKSGRNFFIIALAVSDLIVSSQFCIRGLIRGVAWAYTQGQCMARTSVFLGSVCCSTITTLLLGLDRLAAVKLPLFQQARGARFYALSASVILGYPVVVLVLGHYFAQRVGVIPGCTPPLSLNPLAFKVWTASTVVINIAVVVAYGWLAKYFFRKESVSSTNSADRNQQLGKSVVIIAAVHISTWLLGSVGLFLSQMIEMDAEVRLSIVTCIGILPAINNGCNGYIYIWRSQDFRDVLVGYLSKTPVHRLQSNIVTVSRSPAPSSRFTARVSPVPTSESAF